MDRTLGWQRAFAYIADFWNVLDIGEVCAFFVGIGCRKRFVPCNVCMRVRIFLHV